MTPAIEDDPIVALAHVSRRLSDSLVDLESVAAGHHARISTWIGGGLPRDVDRRGDDYQVEWFVEIDRLDRACISTALRFSRSSASWIVAGDITRIHAGGEETTFESQVRSATTTDLLSRAFDEVLDELLAEAKAQLSAQ